MKNNILGAGWLMLACAIWASQGAAQDAKAGRLKAQSCMVCHGLNGIAVAANAPNLAGENASYISAQLKAFRSGKRKHYQMSIIAAGLSDQDIANLARWYSLIKITAILPELD